MIWENMHHVHMDICIRFGYCKVIISDQGRKFAHKVKEEHFLFIKLKRSSFI